MLLKWMAKFSGMVDALQDVSFTNTGRSGEGVLGEDLNRRGSLDFMRFHLHFCNHDGTVCTPASKLQNLCNGREMAIELYEQLELYEQQVGAVCQLVLESSESGWQSKLLDTSDFSGETSLRKLVGFRDWSLADVAAAGWLELRWCLAH
jgi:hypothetical protein